MEPKGVRPAAGPLKTRRTHGPSGPGPRAGRIRLGREGKDHFRVTSMYPYFTAGL